MLRCQTVVWDYLGYVRGVTILFTSYTSVCSKYMMKLVYYILNNDDGIEMSEYNTLQCQRLCLLVCMEFFYVYVYLLVCFQFTYNIYEMCRQRT